MLESPGTNSAAHFGASVLLFLGIQHYLVKLGYLDLYPWAFVLLGLLGIYHFRSKNG